MIKQCTVNEAVQLVNSTEEIGFLDLREIGPFSEGHPLFAVPVPFSVFEERVAKLVPRPGSRLLLIDGGDGLAPTAAETLREMGYQDITLVDGGIPAWEEAGHTLFEGVNVPSKTLGELAEARHRARLIDPMTLEEWLAEGTRLSFFDCRPPSEYRRMTIPGALNLPTGEIAHRLPALDGDGPIVLTCAGRTRSILGTIGLSFIAPDREFCALENGTQGWALAGLELARGNSAQPLPDLTSAGAFETRARADAFLSKYSISVASTREVIDFLGDSTRTTYLIDVRSDQEAADDRLPAFTHVPCGQIVQATDSFVGLLRARVVLADDLGLRGALAAFWLRSLGHSVHVARIDDELRNLPAFPRPLPPPLPDCGIGPEVALRNVQEGKARFLDMRHSREFSREHVAGSQWETRSGLADRVADACWYIVGDEGPQAELAAREFLRLCATNFAVIRGGFSALRDAGASILADTPLDLSDTIDIVSFASGRHDGDLTASRRYLNWEQGLVSRLAKAERAAFAV